MFFDQIKNSIIQAQAEQIQAPTLIYIGVGTAATNHSANQGPNLANYHQYPPFLQDLKNKIPKLRLYLGLIDPHQEDPPRAVQDHFLRAEGDHFTSQDRTVSLYVWRENVYTDPDENEVADAQAQAPAQAQAHNITEQLRALNYFALNQGVSLLYHDFTGRKVRLLAEYFDQELGENIDQIVYGLSTRADHGCYFDLTQPNAFFPVKIDQHTQLPHTQVLKMFNFFKYINAPNRQNIYAAAAQELRTTYPPETYHFLEVQQEQISISQQAELRNNSMSMLRNIARLLKKDDEVADISNMNLFHFMGPLNRAPFIKMFETKNFSELFDSCYRYIAAQLELIAQIKNLDITGEEMLRFITADEDPYKWYNNIKYFF
jgi:hypothetical protein